MAHEVFISYSSRDKAVADAAVAAIESRGARCWIAPRDIHAGNDWAAAIIDAINSCQLLVLVYSASANESQQIKRELERAVNRGVPMLPFRIENVPMSKAMEYFISTPHWLDALSAPLEPHIERLADTVALLLEEGSAPVASPFEESTDPILPPPAPLVLPSTLLQALAPVRHRLIDIGVILGGVLGVTLLGQVRVGPIWLLPLALLLVAALLGTVRGGLVALGFVALGAAGLPVLGEGRSAWTEVAPNIPYALPALGSLVGMVGASFTVGWLAQRQGWDKKIPTAALLSVIGAAILYVPALIGTETAVLVLRDSRPTAGVLPSLPMLAITVAVLTLLLPQLWAIVTRQYRATRPASPAPAGL